MESVVHTQIPSTKSRLDGLVVSKDAIEAEILKLLKKRPHTPTELTAHFHYKDRSTFSKNYIYPLRDAGEVEKVEGSNYYQLPKQKNTGRTVRKSLNKESEIFQTENFQNWILNNNSKDISDKHVMFARVCLGKTNPKFKIHPDDITKENYKQIIPKMIDAIVEVAKYDLIKGEPHYGMRQCIRGFLQDGVGIKLSKKEATNLRISGAKPKPKLAKLHIKPEQVAECKKLLKKSYLEDEWFLKFGVKAWTFVRPSTIYLIELENMTFYDETVEYVLGRNGKKITDEKVVDYAKFQGHEILSFTRRVCHIEVHENKTDDDFDKYILDPDFVIPLEKFYNVRKSQRKRYLFWDDNKTEFTFENYREIVEKKVDTDNKFFKKILFQVGFVKGDFGKNDRVNYAFRHFGIQMWLIATDYNYDLVAIMSHEDTATLKKYYGERTNENFQQKIKGVMA